MEPARDVTSSAAGAALPYSVERHNAPVRRPETVVLQVDATVSSLDGLAWLIEQREAEVAQRLAALDREAAAQRWSWAELVRARLKLLRPRRAEINELGAAYLTTLSPGAADAASALRRAGITVTLASDVAAEALFGVATALGVSPNELYAPRLRFDAIGAYLGCDLNTTRPDDEGSHAPHRLGASSARTLFVGTRRSAAFAPRGTDDFVAFSGVVAQEGRPEALATIASFHDLAPLVLR